MQAFDSHRRITPRPGTSSTGANSKYHESAEDSPTPKEVFSEIGLILLVCFGLALAAELFARITGVH